MDRGWGNQLSLLARDHSVLRGRRTSLGEGEEVEGEVGGLILEEKVGENRMPISVKSKVHNKEQIEILQMRLQQMRKWANIKFR